IDRLRRAGVSIVYISHKMAEVQRIADRLTVMRDATRIATLRANEADADELIRLMVGRPLERTARVGSLHAGADVLLDVRSLSTDFLDGISFQLRAGEVLGIAGLVGSGRSEIGAALFGLRDRKDIDASLCGARFAPARPAEAIDRGLCLVPEDRRNEALFPTLSPVENTTIATLPRLSSMGLLHPATELAAAAPFHHRLKLAHSAPNVGAAALSGGNQQKAVIARWLMASARVLFLDEPTRGIDVGSKEQVYRIIAELAAQGRGIVFVSSELPELFRCCDRILVLHEGRQAGVVTTAAATQERVLALATGAGRRNGYHCVK
ncbi:MAG: ATP-binding cassette domain-containing protein, partial [Steroidobacteraceae bacterium]